MRVDTSEDPTAVIVLRKVGHGVAVVAQFRGEEQELVVIQPAVRQENAPDRLMIFRPSLGRGVDWVVRSEDAVDKVHVA